MGNRVTKANRTFDEERAQNDINDNDVEGRAFEVFRI
jgi:hypothetical protein